MQPRAFVLGRCICTALLSQICRHTTSKLQADLQEACSIITQLKIENQGLTERMQVLELAVCLNDVLVVIAC